MANKIYLSDVVGIDGGLYRPQFKVKEEYGLCNTSKLNEYVECLIVDKSDGDSGVIYAINHSQIYKYNSTTLIDESSFRVSVSGLGFYLPCICCDNNYIYISMINYEERAGVIVKINKHIMSYESVTSHPFDNAIRSIKLDDDYIYAVGENNYLKKYSKHNMDFIEEEYLYSSEFYAMEIDDKYIYIGGGNKFVRKYNKNNMSNMGETPQFGTTIQFIKADDSYIYVSGACNYLRKYTKSNMSMLGSITTQGSFIRCIEVDDKYIYIGTEKSGAYFNLIEKYDKDTLKLVVVIETDLSNIHSICVSKGNIYLGNYNHISQYRKLNEIEGYIKVN